MSHNRMSFNVFLDCFRSDSEIRNIFFDFKNFEKCVSNGPDSTLSENSFKRTRRKSDISLRLLLSLRHGVPFAKIQARRVCVFASQAPTPIVHAGGAVVCHVWVAKCPTSAHEFRQNEKPVFFGQTYGVASCLERQHIQVVQNQLAFWSALQAKAQACEIGGHAHIVFRLGKVF